VYKVNFGLIPLSRTPLLGSLPVTRPLSNLDPCIPQMRYTTPELVKRTLSESEMPFGGILVQGPRKATTTISVQSGSFGRHFGSF
jgi:hypothetical protein